MSSVFPSSIIPQDQERKRAEFQVGSGWVSSVSLTGLCQVGQVGQGLTLGEGVRNFKWDPGELRFYSFVNV